MKTIAFCFFVLASVPATAQSTLIFGGGIGSYALGDLHAIQDQIPTSLPAGARKTSEFPAYFYYEGGFNYQVTSKFYTGFSLGYGSTGGRVYYADYSGSLAAEQLVSYFSGIVHVGMKFNLDAAEKWYARLDLKPGVTIQKFSFNYLEQLGGNVVMDQTIKTQGVNVFVQPTATFTRKISELFSVDFAAGFHVTVVSGKMKTDDGGTLLFTSSNRPATIDLTGYRLTVGVRYAIRQN